MGKLSTYRKNRARRRAEEKALRAKAKIEATASAKAQVAADKVRAKVDKKELKKSARDAAKASKQQAKSAAAAAKKAARQAERRAEKKNAIERKHTRGLAELEMRRIKTHDKAAYKQLAKEAKLESKRRKLLAKDAKAGRAHERNMAEMDLKKIEAGHLNKAAAKRYVAFAQVLLPVLAPLALKGVTTAQGQGGIPASGNPSEALKSRISTIDSTVGKLTANRTEDAETARFAEQVKKRLTDLNTAVESAENVPTRERRVIHQSVSEELNRVNKEVLARLGVKA